MMLVLPRAVLEQARTFFEDCGASGCEGTAMIKMGPGGVVLVVPEQVPARHGVGVSVQVTAAGQIQLATALASDELYAARIHSHPCEAFHSPTDDANPVLTYHGALSIVVPYFGLGLRRGLDACAVYRLQQGVWRELPPGADRARWVRTEEPQ